MRIGILQCGHSPQELVAEFGGYGEKFTRLLEGHGFEFDIYKVVDGQFPKSTDVADGWLITGSRHGAYDDLAWIQKLEEFLRVAFSEKRPIIGICFGHQVLAQALGGTVEKYSGGWSVGATKYTMAESGETVTLNAWHQDQITKRPKGARVLASSPFCENAMLAYGDTALTIQPHPEFNAGFVLGLIDGRGKGVVPDNLRQVARDRLNVPCATSQTVKMMVEFFKKTRTVKGM